MKALILVDLQNDFLPGGALPVAEGDRVIPVANALMEQPFDLILATKDWHPQDHGSFAANHGKEPGEVIDLHGLEQILWPVHCVQGSEGAEFAPVLQTGKIDKIIYKGTDKEIDSYSTFFDNGHRKGTGLVDYLKEKNVTEVYIAGLATDYCVKYSVLDALGLGFKTYIILEGCRAVNLNEGDEEKAIEEMRRAGAEIIEKWNMVRK